MNKAEVATDKLFRRYPLPSGFTVSIIRALSGMETQCWFLFLPPDHFCKWERGSLSTYLGTDWIFTLYTTVTSDRRCQSLFPPGCHMVDERFSPRLCIPWSQEEIWSEISSVLLTHRKLWERLTAEGGWGPTHGPWLCLIWHSIY